MSGFASQSMQLRRVVAAAALVMVVGACHREAGNAPATATASAVASDPAVVTLTPAMASRLAAAPVKIEEIAEARDISGRIEPDAGKIERIGASVTGRIAKLAANVGDRVTVGQPLALLSSPELTQAQIAFLRAASTATLAERAAERARQLLAADAIAAADAQRRESEAQIARSETQAAADQLRLLGVTNASIEQLRRRGKIDSNAAVTSTLNGVVIERNVSQGQVVQPADKLFVVANLDSVWVVGGIAEQAASQIVRGQQVTVEVPALAHATFEGRVVFVADTVDPSTRTVQVRTEVKNPGHKLKPEMLAILHVSSERKPVLAVPAKAVVREGDKDYVFVRLSDTQFRFTQVELGVAVGELRPVKSGLQEGVTIVVDGAFQLNAERKRAELE